MTEQKTEIGTGYFLVRYDVEGFGERTAGPYHPRAEALKQADDIRGYEGVSNVRLEEVTADVRGER